MIGDLSGTIILVPHLWLIGDRAEHFYFGLIKARNESRKLLVLLPYELPWRLRYNLTNAEVIALESSDRVSPSVKLPHVIGGTLITLYFAFTRAMGFLLRRTVGYELSHFQIVPSMGTRTLWQPMERMARFSWKVADAYDWRRRLESPPKVTLSREKSATGRRLQGELGLPEDAWFVCLHVRESGYRQDTGFWRNGTIANYRLAIDEIVDRGGWVVRMGDATMERLPRIDGVIDYPFTPQKSPLMDVYLISRCDAFLGTSSGLLEVAVLFQRPIILTNMTNWLWGFPPKKGDIGLLKHLFSKSKQRFLSVREWIEEGSTANFYRRIGDDYRLYENDPEEIRQIVKEFFERGDAWQPTQLQTQFNELRIREGRTQLVHGQPMVADPCDDANFRYQMASRLEAAQGLLGARFLEENWAGKVKASENLQ